MTTIRQTIPMLDTSQLDQLVDEHQAAQRTATSKTYVQARNNLARVDGFAVASQAAAAEVGGFLDTAGFTGGRDIASAALRWALLAEQFQSELTSDEYDALTASFNTVVGVPA